MISLHYISPSLLPSRSANSVHVMLQCDGLVRAGTEVSLYAKRTVPDAAELPGALNKAYGVDARRLRLHTYYSRSTRADTLRIAALSAWHVARRPRTEAVLSRNLYAAYVLGVLCRRPMLFETHQLESGPRKRLQRAIMSRPWITTVAISEHLVECLQEHHGMRPRRPLVLHDAAPDGIGRLAPDQRRPALAALVGDDVGRWDAVCGYFGHLYTGRGLEVIDAMAGQRPNCLFVVFGGNDADVQAHQAANRHANLRFMGHVPHPIAQSAMTGVDVLLMPYQRSVSIGIEGHDTARWMSPMKMFEYLASGVPVISSDLPVLREVLNDGSNCLLVPADKPEAWVSALDRLITDADFAGRLGERAHADYCREHTWTRRAERLLDAARAL